MKPHPDICPTADDPKAAQRECPYVMINPKPTAATVSPICGCCYDCRLECLCEGILAGAEYFALGCTDHSVTSPEP